MENSPALWINNIPKPQDNGHKYHRGQVCVLGGVTMTGAACMSADAAARMGAGIVTILSPRRTLLQRIKCTNPVTIYRSYKPYIITRENIEPADFIAAQKIKSNIVNVIGPGLGTGDERKIRTLVEKAAHHNMPIILDADGINAFSGHLDTLTHIASRTPLILTPHEGEFKKLCPHLIGLLKEDRIKATQNLAHALKATVILKGRESIIAAPDETVINSHASPYLATAGTGDVLTGIIASLWAQAMQPFDAACAATWIHGQAAKNKGAGLVATDIIDELPNILKSLDSFSV